MVKKIYLKIYNVQNKLFILNNITVKLFCQVLKHKNLFIHLEKPMLVFNLSQLVAIFLVNKE